MRSSLTRKILVKSVTALFAVALAVGGLAVVHEGSTADAAVAGSDDHRWE